MPAFSRILLLLPLLGLTGLIVWAILSGDFGAAGAWLTGNPWGLVTLADLYAGLLLFAIVIAATERRLWPAVFWITPLFVLGNVWTALWLLVRGPILLRRLARPEERRNEVEPPTA